MSIAVSDRKNVFYIPAGVPFVNVLARAVLSGGLPCPNQQAPSVSELPDWTILLPTRRATRALMQAFNDEGDGTACLLPRIQPLGDVDEDEMALSDTGLGNFHESIPNAISGLERQFILFHLIHNWVREFHDNPLAQMLSGNNVHAFDLARSLGRLVDDFDTNSINLSIIDDLFDGEFAEHRQQILGFLSIVQKQLPEKMAELGKIGASDHRNRLMRTHTRFIAEGKATGPVIAAGSTGSIPATAELLSCIASQDNGAVVLPGLDTYLDNESWDCLPENHPQFGMRELLTKMGIDREDVQLLPGITEHQTASAQNWLASEIMRPAKTTDQWRQAVTESEARFEAATANITMLKADDQRGEALTIALIMRNALEENKSTALITPDRQLARNVKAEISRWDIEIDDSAGETLLHSPPALFLRLLLEAAKSHFSPIMLKALLAHPFACFGTPAKEITGTFTNLEIALLRSDTPYEGLQGMLDLCKKQMENSDKYPYAHPAFKQLTEVDWQGVFNLSERLLKTLQPLADLFEKYAAIPLANHILVHLQVAEAACERDGHQQLLWQGEWGEKLAETFSAMQAAAHLAPEMNVQEYGLLLERQLSEAIVRPKHVRHGSLAIYGLLEARLISADVMILGGLNETIWPPVGEVDAWLTRPQLRDAGLPVPERRIGLSAHDFAQGFCAARVYLTYSNKLGNSPAVPSRWILRLSALLKAADLECACGHHQQQPWLKWASELEQPGSFEPAGRPGPEPDTNLRPVSFSVTGIESLLKNPYAFFADKILHLKPLNSLGKQIGAAERGSLVHLALQNFIEAYPDHLPLDGVEKLVDEFDELLDASIPDESLRVFWRPQLARMADWFIERETKLRSNRLSSHLEVSGQYCFKIADMSYRLTARADRVDILDDRTSRIIDYKTGVPPTFKESAKEFSPQLLLEALICTKGGFVGIGALPASQLIYMKLSGGIPAGEIKSAPANLQPLVRDAEAGMLSLITAYSHIEQPYMANPAPFRVDVEREYDYLSRWREWAHLVGQGKPDE